MKCPYRICEITNMEDDATDEDGYIIPQVNTKHEIFEECHLTECPFFCVVAGKQTCRKAEKEVQ